MPAAQGQEVRLGKGVGAALDVRDHAGDQLPAVEPGQLGENRP
jgi:hypothetical protein